MNRIENLKEKIKSKFGHLDTVRKDKFTIQEEDGRFMFIPDSFEELAWITMKRQIVKEGVKYYTK